MSFIFAFYDDIVDYLSYFVIQILFVFDETIIKQTLAILFFMRILIPNRTYFAISGSLNIMCTKLRLCHAFYGFKFINMLLFVIISIHSVDKHSSPSYLPGCRKFQDRLFIHTINN